MDDNYFWKIVVERCFESKNSYNNVINKQLKNKINKETNRIVKCKFRLLSIGSLSIHFLNVKGSTVVSNLSFQQPQSSLIHSNSILSMNSLIFNILDSHTTCPSSTPSALARWTAIGKKLRVVARHEVE